MHKPFIPIYEDRNRDIVDRWLKGETQEAIGKRYNITKQGVSRILSKARRLGWHNKMVGNGVGRPGKLWRK